MACNPEGESFSLATYPSVSLATFPKEELDGSDQPKIFRPRLQSHFNDSRVEAVNEECRPQRGLREVSEPESEPPYWHHVNRVEASSLRTPARPTCRALIRGFLLGVLLMIIIGILAGLPNTRQDSTPSTTTTEATTTTGHGGEDRNILDHQKPTAQPAQDGGLHVSRNPDSKRVDHSPRQGAASDQAGDRREGGATSTTRTTGILQTEQPGLKTPEQSFRPSHSVKMPEFSPDYWDFFFYSEDDEAKAQE